MIRILLVAICLCGLMHLKIASAQMETPDRLGLKIPPSLLMVLQVADTPQRAVDLFVPVVMGAASDKTVLTRQDIVLKEEKTRKAFEKIYLDTLRKYDLDLDGKVTREEAEKAAGQMIGQPVLQDKNVEIRMTADLDKQKSFFVGRIMRLDLNKDGVVTTEEVLSPQQALDPATGASRESFAEFLFLDADGDGRVTLKEAEMGVVQAFRFFDADGDGKLSAQEKEAVRTAMRQ